MAENRYKEFHMRIPVENHATAAWADRETLKEVSRVNLPDENLVAEAKEYVDENHK
jgi:hypothetical protein